RVLTGAANALTGSVLKVEDASTGSAAHPDVLLINEVNTSSLSTTNLINATLNGTSKFSVSRDGNVAVAGNITANTLQSAVSTGLTITGTTTLTLASTTTNIASFDSGTTGAV